MFLIKLNLLFFSKTDRQADTKFTKLIKILNPLPAYMVHPIQDGNLIDQPVPKYCRTRLSYKIGWGTCSWQFLKRRGNCLRIPWPPIPLGTVNSVLYQVGLILLLQELVSLKHISLLHQVKTKFARHNFKCRLFLFHFIKEQAGAELCLGSNVKHFVKGVFWSETWKLEK